VSIFFYTPVQINTPELKVSSVMLKVITDLFITNKMACKTRCNAHKKILVVYHLLEKTGWSTVVVNGTRQIPNGNFHGDALVPFPRLFPNDRSKGGTNQTTWNQWKLANGTRNFHSEIPFGNFGLLSRNHIFPRKFPFGETKLLFPFTIRPKFPDFVGKW